MLGTDRGADKLTQDLPSYSFQNQSSYSCGMGWGSGVARWRRATRTLSRNEKPLPWGSECSGNYQPRGNGKTARGIGSADPRMLPPPRNRKPAGDLLGRSNRSRAGVAGSWTTRASGSPCLSRSYRRPETESLPVTELTGSNLRHARPGAGRALVGNGETGRAQSQRISTPSRASPTGRRIGGYDYKTESFQRPRAEQHAHFREMKNSNFFGAPSPGARSVREITSREETERPPEESARQIPACSSLPGTESPVETWLGRSNRSRAGLADASTTRVQARRVPADPTADRKPKACQ